MAYAVESGKVRYAGNVVRGADGATFHVLEGAETWGRDGRHVYWAGLKVAGARPATFVAFDGDVGADDRKVFYRLSRRQKPMSAKRPKGFGVDVEVLGDGDRLVLKSGGHAYAAAPSGIGSALPVDAASFELIGGGYAKDAQRVYWFKRSAEVLPLPDADLGSFALVGGVARDKQGRFLRGRRDDARLPVEESANPSEVLLHSVVDLVATLLPRYFELFDHVLPNDERVGSSSRGALTQVPALSVSLEGAELVATVETPGGERALRARLSCFELLAARVYATARDWEVDGALCLRVLPQACRWPGIESDVIPLWHRQLDLAYLLHGTGRYGEARLLLAQVMREQRSRPRTEDLESDPRLRAEKLLPGVLEGLPHPVAAKGTTTQAAMKWIIKQGLHASEDPCVRRSVGDEVLAMVRSTSGQPARFAGLSAPLLSLLDDPEPAVRIRGAVAFDLLASKLCYFSAYDVALPVLGALAKGGFNLDLQLARQWECYAAVGRDRDADEAWAGAVALDRPGARAPRQHTGLHTDYPSLEVWRAFGELRLAAAHQWAAQGEHPSEELRRKKQVLEIQGVDADEWASLAKERCAAASETMQRLAREAPAAVIGMCLAEFAEGLSRATGEGQISDDRFVMWSQYVDYRRYGIPYDAGGGAIAFAGEFERIGHGRFRALSAGADVGCALGRAFGVEYRFGGGPPGRRLPGTVRVERPLADSKNQVDEYPVLVFLGLRENFVFVLESPDELVPGEWKISITLHSAAPPADYPCRGELVAGDALATLHQTFRLALG